MDFKGTKGKWSVKDNYIVDCNGSILSEVHLTTELNEYDMLLMSKAPEMLEMLNIIVGNIERHPIKYTIEEKLQMAQQLIKEATKP